MPRLLGLNVLRDGFSAFGFKPSSGRADEGRTHLSIFPFVLRSEDAVRASRRIGPLRLALAGALLPFASSCEAKAPAERPPLGLMGTLPIYWGESAAFGDVLNGQGEAHWARARLEQRFTLEPLDALTAEDLAGLDYLLLAQPRALSGAENVALDEWVRRGGRLLLFADPMLTGASRFPVGDRRRPQDVTLLSPILSHWGLAMDFDVAAPEGVALLEGAGAPIPVNRPGQFATRAGDCTLAARAVLARCRIGEGTATILADAALLDLYNPHPAAAAALDSLVTETFGQTGEIAGEAR